MNELRRRLLQSMLVGGAATLAGYGIGARFELIMVPLIFGVGSAAIAVVGVAAGAGRCDRAIRAGWTAAGLAGLVVGSLGVALALLANTWASAFSSDPQAIWHGNVRKMALGQLRVVLAVGIQHAYPRCVQGGSLQPWHGTRGAAMVATPQASVRAICLAMPRY